MPSRRGWWATTRAPARQRPHAHALVAVGQLALHEAYKCYNVGERLKTPSVPVWLVFSESHYSVLWDSC